MIKFLFEKSGQMFIITINNRVIKYTDKLQGAIWGCELQYLPRDEELINKLISKIKQSRNKIPYHMIELFDVPKEELEEYNNAKTEEELRELVLKDCKVHGCKLVKEEKVW